ncbi:MAG: hypothetical protein KF690_11690 [Bacteroidetes bacterium]|nr:hypothetical protein [Bacteroidota bacterium]
MEPIYNNSFRLPTIGFSKSLLAVAAFSMPAQINIYENRLLTLQMSATLSPSSTYNDLENNRIPSFSCALENKERLEFNDFIQRGILLISKATDIFKESRTATRSEIDAFNSALESESTDNPPFDWMS